MLDQGDAAVLAAPRVRFGFELERLKLIPTTVQARPGAYAEETRKSELLDLSAALAQQKVDPAEIEKIVAAHKTEREKLETYVSEHSSYETYLANQKEGHVYFDSAKNARTDPKFPMTQIVPGLPQEFAVYFEGARVWQNPGIQDKAMAQEAWERVLQLPRQQRHFKSTWAAFMLGKSLEVTEPEKAVTWYQKVRALAGQGFSDSTGLAAASLGLEARVNLRQKKFAPAFDLYLEQLASGDGSAENSLRFTAEQALKLDSASLAELAKNRRAQSVITAYLLSKGPAESSENSAETPTAPLTDWLEAIEQAGISDVQSAEKFALLAYQQNQMDLAARWVRKAAQTPTGMWLQAKLLLREGKLDLAAAMLSRVAKHFAANPPDTNHFEFKDALYTSCGWTDSTASDSDIYGLIPVSRSILGELGTVRLARREYVESLDCLLRSGFWMDAAYVGERVLSTDELKAYVDLTWPAASPEHALAEKKDNTSDPTASQKLRRDIRYLLARRLMRDLRGDEAAVYYPAELRAQFATLCLTLRTGWNEATAADLRARALFGAACILKTNGMEFIGTELQPDWSIHGGSYEEGITWEYRSTNAQSHGIVSASTNEILRASQANPDPDQRFHYRYTAASLAWEAAKVLWTAGRWLKDRDPNTADVFYKSLVRRNRKTALGAEADRQRWFPECDDNGNVIPGVDRTKRRLELKVIGPPDPGSDAIPEPNPGEAGIEPANVPVSQITPASGVTFRYEYIVRSGDSLRVIVQQLNHMGIEATVESLVEANNLVTLSLRVGQRLRIP